MAIAHLRAAAASAGPSGPEGPVQGRSRLCPFQEGRRCRWREARGDDVPDLLRDRLLAAARVDDHASLGVRLGDILEGLAQLAVEIGGLILEAVGFAPRAPRAGAPAAGPGRQIADTSHTGG